MLYVAQSACYTDDLGTKASGHAICGSPILRMIRVPRHLVMLYVAQIACYTDDLLSMCICL